MAHLPALLSVVKGENLLVESQARVVEEFDIFIRDTFFDNAQRQLDVLVKEILKGESFEVIEGWDSITVSVRPLFLLAKC